MRAGKIGHATLATGAAGVAARAQR